MTEGCAARGELVAPYVDGELDAGDAEAFALHLAGCEACRTGLHDALQLVALEARATGMPAARVATRPPRERVRRWNRRQRLAIAIGMAAVVAVCAVVVVGRRGGGTVAPETPLALETADVRSFEGRVAYAAADRHRRYAVVRAGAPAAAADVIALPTLAELERRGDLHGVAAAYLLLGDAARARPYLERAVAGPDVAADRALVALTTGHPDDALIALDGVLAVAPRHPQALWNRALALRDLGLPRMAVAAFDAAAALGEPGWAEEARTRAGALAAETDARQAKFAQLVAAGRRLATAPEGISDDLARQVPGSARIYFQDAVRGATTAGAVRALAPLARTLDAVAGDHALIDQIERTARADFRLRGPLAARYQELVDRAPVDPASVRALRAARQDDLMFGALLRSRPDGDAVPPEQLVELRRLADATGQPWFQMIATVQEAIARVAQGDAAAAEHTALAGLASCRTAVLDVWCARLDRVLGQSYLLVRRFGDARRVLDDALARARRSGEWTLEQQVFEDLVTLEERGDDGSHGRLAVLRAYRGELVHRVAGGTDRRAPDR
jgi:tetratricopeptide (TPR) repeat protein